MGEVRKMTLPFPIEVGSQNRLCLPGPVCKALKIEKGTEVYLTISLDPPEKG